MAPIGLILTGGPGSVYAADAPKADPAIFALGVPVLGICYGCQLMAQYLGGSVVPAQEDTAREYGRTDTHFDTGCALFAGLQAARTRPSPTRAAASTACSSTPRSTTPSTART